MIICICICRGISSTNPLSVNIKKENSRPCKKAKQINDKVNSNYKIKIYIMSICEKLTVLAPWTRQAEMTVATIDAISMITPKMKIPGGPRHSSSYHHLIITVHKTSQRPLNGPRTPVMDSNQSGAVGGLGVGSPFPESLTHLGASRRLRSQKCI